MAAGHRGPESGRHAVGDNEGGYLISGRIVVLVPGDHQQGSLLGPEGSAGIWLDSQVSPCAMVPSCMS